MAYRTIGYLVAVEFLGLLGFVLLSSENGSPIRFLPLLIAVVAVGFIAYAKASANSYKAIGYISVVASIILVVLFQVLGRTVFPGLVKDVEFFTLADTSRAGIMLAIGVCGHFLLFSLARMMRR
jgi:hypothetical protein